MIVYGLTLPTAGFLHFVANWATNQQKITLRWCFGRTVACSNTGESGCREGASPQGSAPADFEGTGMIYTGALSIASECVRRGFGECRLVANCVPDVPSAPVPVTVASQPHASRDDGVYGRS